MRKHGHFRQAFRNSKPVSTILRLVELLSIERRISLALDSALAHGLK